MFNKWGMEMKKLIYEEVYRHMLKLYNQGSYDRAYRFLSIYSSRFPQHEKEILYWRSRLANSAGLSKTAIRILEMSIEKGYLCEYLNNEDLGALRGDPEYEALLRTCIKNQ